MDPYGANKASSRLVEATVEGETVFIHESILTRSPGLFTLYNDGSQQASQDSVVIHDVGLLEFEILMLAIYGIRRSILGYEEYTGVHFIKALTLCEQFRCQPVVYDSIAKCVKEYFHRFSYWMSIPDNVLTNQLHIEQMIDINEAYMAYKVHFRRGRPCAFRKISFGVLLWKFCPSHIYNKHSHLLDHGLTHAVSLAGIRCRDYVQPFAAEDIELFSPV
jgi:hypothetical protein